MAFYLIFMIFGSPNEFYTSSETAADNQRINSCLQNQTCLLSHSYLRLLNRQLSVVRMGKKRGGEEKLKALLLSTYPNLDLFTFKFLSYAVK